MTSLPHCELLLRVSLELLGHTVVPVGDGPVVPRDRLAELLHHLAGPLGK